MLVLGCVVLLDASCSGRTTTRPPRASAATSSTSLATGTGRIDLHVTAIPAIEGRLLVVLYDEQTYLKDGLYVAKMAIKVEATDMRVALEHVARGRYLVVVTHDANGNDTLDTNVIGLPTEAYGFSRDARGAFGPPSFDDGAFEFDGQTAAISVELR